MKANGKKARLLKLVKKKFQISSQYQGSREKKEESTGGRLTLLETFGKR